MVVFSFNSNTTLVKVKYLMKARRLKTLSNSNTTLVKVKLYPNAPPISLPLHSNTTLVKVKLQQREMVIDSAIKFKYNTC